MQGLIFDIKEFSLHDGPGIRTTVFLKGCPLRCVWCHNPEGLSPKAELFTSASCRRCGLCYRACDHEDCRPHGRCLHVCPQNALRVAGETWEIDALAQKLLAQAAFLRQNEGGVTLSGGEPLLQADFSAALLDRLHGHVHLAIETSGYAKEADFRRVIGRCDFVMMDLKLMDAADHRRATGVDNAPILANATWLKDSGIPHVFRTPLVPGITDTEANLAAIRAFVGEDKWETLPYNTLAGAKYAGVGRTFEYQLPT